MWIVQGRLAPFRYLSLADCFWNYVRMHGRWKPDDIPLRPVCFSDGTHTFFFSFLGNRGSVPARRAQKTNAHA